MIAAPIMKGRAGLLRTLAAGFLGMAIALAAAPVRAVADAPGTYVVDADLLNVRLAPSPGARIIRRLERGGRVEVLQVVGDWARLTEYYDGARHRAEGMVAEWVSASFLVDSLAGAQAGAAAPATPSPPGAAFDGDLASALALSDDLARHREVFIAAAERLVQAGTCTAADFARTQGWTRAGSEQPVTYFVICLVRDERVTVFLDPATGTVFH